jgi:hypothetical protein
MSPGIFLCGGGFFISVQKTQKYIAAMPNGYKTDLIMFFQISRTMQRKWHAKRTSRAPRNGLTASPPQKLLCLKMALAWLLLSIILLLMPYYGLKHALVI